MSATLNDPNAPGEVRQPRLRVMLGTEEIPNALTATINSNNWYQADSFNVEFALFGDAKYGPAWWSQQDDMLLDVQVSLDDGNAWTSLIVGVADHISLHFAAGVVMIDGRDMTARLIEAKTQESFANKTSSEVVAILAARHGMVADATDTQTLLARYWSDQHVDATTTTTTTKKVPIPSLGPRSAAGVAAYEKQYGPEALSNALVGTYWKNEHTTHTLNQLSRATTEWDLLTALAQHEGFDLYVTGKTLHFHPTTPPDATPYAVQWTPPALVPDASYGLSANVQDLRCERALTLARDIQVTVKSWHSGKGRSFVKSVRAIGAKSSKAAKAANQKGFAGSTQQYVYVFPNLTEDQALKKAQSILADLSKHERVIDFQLPGELVLTPRNLISLRGTGTDFDQTYFCDSISRTISFDAGFGQSVRAKNRDGRSQTVVA